MDWPIYTVILMVVFPLVFIGIDVWLLLDKRRDDDTYSSVLRRAGRKWIAIIMIMCFGMGLLAGHFWWTRCTKADVKELCE